MLLPLLAVSLQTTWYVDAGAVAQGDGSRSNPYVSVTFAMDQAATVDGDTVGEKETVVRLRKGFDREQSEQGGNATLRFAYTVQRGGGEASFSTGDGTPLVAALEELLSKSKTLERLDLSDNKFNPLARRKLASASARRETAALPACDVEFSRRSEGTGLGAASADRGGEGGGG